MPIFKKDKKTVKKESPKETTEVKKEVVSSVEPTLKPTLNSVGGSGEVDNILIRPHITEKASMHAESNVYVFEVNKRINKTLVKNAVKELYKVNPVKVNIVNSPSKNVTSKGIKGVKSGKKKALVYLKKGDTIDIV